MCVVCWVDLCAYFNHVCVFSWTVRLPWREGGLLWCEAELGWVQNSGTLSVSLALRSGLVHIFWTRTNGQPHTMDTHTHTNTHFRDTGKFTDMELTYLLTLTRRETHRQIQRHGYKQRNLWLKMIYSHLGLIIFSAVQQTCRMLHHYHCWLHLFQSENVCCDSYIKLYICGRKRSSHLNVLSAA